MSCIISVPHIVTCTISMTCRVRDVHHVCDLCHPYVIYHLHVMHGDDVCHVYMHIMYCDMYHFSCIISHASSCICHLSSPCHALWHVSCPWHAASVCHTPCLSHAASVCHRHPYAMHCDIYHLYVTHSTISTSCPPHVNLMRFGVHSPNNVLHTSDTVCFTAATRCASKQRHGTVGDTNHLSIPSSYLNYHLHVMYCDMNHVDDMHHLHVTHSTACISRDLE